MSCTRCVGGALYGWYYVHVVHMILVHVWYCAHFIHVVWRACGTRYVHCVALYIGYICMSYVLYRVYVYEFVVSHIVCGCMSCDVHCVRIRVMFFHTPDIGVCIVWCCKLGVVVCVVCQV